MMSYNHDMRRASSSRYIYVALLCICSPVTAISETLSVNNPILPEPDVVDRLSLPENPVDPAALYAVQAAPIDPEQALRDFLSFSFLYSDMNSTAQTRGHSVSAQFAKVRSLFGFPLSGLWPSGVAAWVGLQPETPRQGSFSRQTDASGNSTDIVERDGARNFVAVWQDGFSNLVGPLRFWGEDHSVAVMQRGVGNLAYLGAPLGFGQSIGLIQSGTNSVDIFFAGFGEDNAVFVEQIGLASASVIVEGARNSIEVMQGYSNGIGGENMFKLEVIGLGNILSIEQNGDNLMSVSVLGHKNNLTSAFEPALNDLGISPGELVQTGRGNNFTVNITGSGNQFGGSQTGQGGTVNLTQTGDGNVGGVVQSGDGGTVSVFQSGSGNSMSVSQ